VKSWGWCRGLRYGWAVEREQPGWRNRRSRNRLSDQSANRIQEAGCVHCLKGDLVSISFEHPIEQVLLGFQSAEDFFLDSPPSDEIDHPYGAILAHPMNAGDSLL
jgi:hypothetical protein